jgi:4-amino-4-deoxy-L-arabinose transferase-like glycosyltransferase
VLVAIAYLALALHGLGDAHIVGDDEAREVAIVRDVVAGNLLWPTFNGTDIPDKPTLYHWLAALPVAVFGFSETSVRLVAALAAAATVGFTLLLGTRLLSPLAGTLAALVLASTPTFLDHARVARPDTLLVLCVSVALGAAFLWWRDGHRRDATLALVATGVGVLAKGPVAPALVAVAVGGFLLWQRDLRPLPRLLTPLGVLAFVVLASGWYVLAWYGWGDRFVEQHLVGRYVRNLAGGLARGEAYSPKSWWHHLTFYPLHLPAVALPWTPFVVVACWRLWRYGRFADPRARFLVCWALAPVVVFTPAEWKLRYYLLPSLPALALLVAPTLAALLEPWPLRRLRLTPASAVAGTVVLLAVLAAAWVALSYPDRLSPADQEVLAVVESIVPGEGSGLAVVAGLAAGVLGVVVACQAWGALAAATFAVTLAWMTIGMPLLEQATTQRDSLRAFAEAVAARFPDQPLAFYARPVRAVIAYVGRPIPALERRATRIVPGTGIIALEPAHAALAAAGYVGPPLATGAGRVGNLERATLVLAEGREPPATRPETPPPVGRPEAMRYGPDDG